MSEDDGKTEVEFAGVKFRGGKIFVIITALSTLGGGLYAGFEFWKDYMNMKEKIENIKHQTCQGLTRGWLFYEQIWMHYKRLNR